jgi:hypothetical protein
VWAYCCLRELQKRTNIIAGFPCRSHHVTLPVREKQNIIKHQQTNNLNLRFFEHGQILCKVEFSALISALVISNVEVSPIDWTVGTVVVV